MLTEHKADAKWGFLKNIVNIDTFFDAGGKKSFGKSHYRDIGEEIRKEKARERQFREERAPLEKKKPSPSSSSKSSISSSSRKSSGEKIAADDEGEEPRKKEPEQVTADDEDSSST